MKALFYFIFIYLLTFSQYIFIMELAKRYFPNITSPLDIVNNNKSRNIFFILFGIIILGVFILDVFFLSSYNVLFVVVENYDYNITGGHSCNVTCISKMSMEDILNHHPYWFLDFLCIVMDWFFATNLSPKSCDITCVICTINTAVQSIDLKYFATALTNRSLDTDLRVVLFYFPFISLIYIYIYFRKNEDKVFLLKHIAVLFTPVLNKISEKYFHYAKESIAIRHFVSYLWKWRKYIEYKNILDLFSIFRYFPLQIGSLFLFIIKVWWNWIISFKIIKFFGSILILILPHFYLQEQFCIWWLLSNYFTIDLFITGALSSSFICATFVIFLSSFKLYILYSALFNITTRFFSYYTDKKIPDNLYLVDKVLSILIFVLSSNYIIYTHYIDVTALPAEALFYSINIWTVNIINIILGLYFYHRKEV